MRFELFTLPLLAAIAEAAAIKGSSSSQKVSSSVCTSCPVTIQDTASAMSSVMSQMTALSPKAQITTTSITGSPIAATGVAKMTTATPVSVKPTSSASYSSSTAKSTSSSSSKRRQRRATSTAASSSSTTKATTSATPSSACAVQPNFGYTYVPSNPQPSAFLKDATLRQQYMSAPVPTNYTWRFAGFYASQSQPGYLFYTELSSYNTTQCASICDSQAACKGFNIYFERNPTLLPGDGCANPPPQTNVRCAFYGQGVSEANAVNVGSWRSSFAVVITGANGYSKQ